MFEFRLMYQGQLLADRNGHRGWHKHNIRRYFHQQLVNLWTTKYPLLYRADPAFTFGTPMPNDKVGVERVSSSFSWGGKRVLPIATQDNWLACGIDIILLCRDFRSVINSGDLDNRVKTLIDALQIPTAKERPGQAQEDPLCVVMENDKFISEIKVLGDKLYAAPGQIIESPAMSEYTGEPKTSEAHVLAIVHITMKPVRHVPGNEDFL